MFNGLKLSIVVTTEALAEITAEVLIKVTTEIAMKAAAEAAAELITDIFNKMELKVLFITIYCWDSLESYTSFST